MVDRYPHADACRSSLERMGAATVQMCLSTAEFSSRADSSGGSLLRKDIADNTANDTKPMEETPTEQPQSTKVPTKRKAADDPIPQFDMNLEQLLSGQDTSLKPRDHPILDDSNDQIVKHLQPEQNPFLFPEYIEPSDSGEAQNLGIQDQNPLPDLTPMSIPSPCLDLDLDLDHDLDQLSDHGTQPSISLDFLDFDLPEPDIDLIPIIADGEGSCEGGNEGDGGEESTKLYDPFGDESGDDDNDDHQTNKLDPDPPQGSNLGFSISVDSQLELEENGYYDFMDAFLV